MWYARMHATAVKLQVCLALAVPVEWMAGIRHPHFAAGNSATLYWAGSLPCSLCCWFAWVQALTPRQVRLLASAPDAHNPTPTESEEAVCNSSGMSTLREIDPPYMYNSRTARRNIQERLER